MRESGDECPHVERGGGEMSRKGTRPNQVCSVVRVIFFFLFLGLDISCLSV